MTHDKVLIQTKEKRQIVDVTDEVNRTIAAHKVEEGLCTLFVQHTTAALTTGEMGERTPEDFLEFLEKIVPAMQFRHAHDPSHAPDHMIGSLIGPSVTIPVKGGKLSLGTWQSVMFVELDGPRERTIEFTLLS